MNTPCPKRTDCECIDSPFENLTSELPDVAPRFVRQTWVPTNPDKNITFGMQYTACRGLCISYVSQEEADECARNMAMECGVNTTDTVPGEPTPSNPIIPVGLFFNSQRIVSASCPDNSEFYFVVAAGRFSAPSQLEADMIADSWAQNLNVPQYRFCCKNTQCCCGGVTYGYTPGNAVPIRFEITYPGGGSPNGPFTFEILSGSLPTGMTMQATPGNGLSFDLLGSCSIAGNYTFRLKFTDDLGNFLVKDATIGVIGILTSALPDYDVGVPYSYQLLAAGGSGNYAWKILSGTLPTGLTLSVSGLISGTPTAANGTPLSFEVIDTTCEAVNRSFYVPRVSMTTQAVNQVATLRGFTGFTNSNTLFRTATYAGYVKATYYPWGGIPTSPPDPQIDPNLVLVIQNMVYNGASHYNYDGTTGSVHTKKWYSGATGTDYKGDFAIFGKNDLSGWKDRYNVIFDRFVASNNSNALVSLNPAMAASSPLYLVFRDDLGSVYYGQSFFDVFGNQLDPVVGGYPKFDMNLIPVTGFQEPQGLRLGKFVRAVPECNYTIILSDPYDINDAFAHAQVTVNNSAVAVNRRQSGDRYVTATVNFQLQCAGLLPGESYTVAVQFWNMTTGATTTQTYTFTATSTTQIVNGTVPTPAAGQQIMVRNPRIAYT